MSPPPGRSQPSSNVRTERKAQVFAGALKRLEQRLAQLITQDHRKQTPCRKPVRKSPHRPGAQRKTIRRKKQRSQVSSDAALAPRIVRQLKKSKLRAIQGHIRARGKRSQGTRDAR